MTLLVEGPPPTTLSTENLAGYGYLSLVGSALAYALWFRGIHALSATRVTFLGLLSPLVATSVGWLALDQELTAVQALGGLVVLAALVAAQTQHTRGVRPRRPVTDRPAAFGGDLLPAARTSPRGASVMRITVFGAAGNVGTRVVTEALSRGHEVTADELLVDAGGNSTISMEDLAVALLDEAERPRHHRTRFTVAY